MGDIYNLSRELSKIHNLPGMTLIYQENGGFAFTMKKSDLEEQADGELPRGFVNAVMQKGRWVFSSMKLVCP